MKRVLLPSTVLLAGLVIGGLCAQQLPRGSNTVVSLSPDESVVVRVIEIPRMIDRNFLVEVERGGRAQTIFTSPDEGLPIGSERVIWSADGRFFLLLGRHFNVHPDAALADGRQLYLLHDLSAGRTWCNATQQESLPRFTVEQVRAIAWAHEGVTAGAPATTTTAKTAGGP